MTTTTKTTTTTGMISAGDVELYVDQRGTGPDVLLIAGLSDPAEAWTFQLEALADSYRMTAFDNRGAGRSPIPPDGFTVADMADDAAEVLRALGIASAHVAGFSGGAATAQHLALRHPELVRSLVLDSTWARAGPVPAYVHGGVDLAAQRCPERAGDDGSLLHVHLHASGARERHGRRDHRRRDGLPVPAVA